MEREEMTYHLERREAESKDPVEVTSKLPWRDGRPGLAPQSPDCIAASTSLGMTSFGKRAEQMSLRVA